MEHDASRAHDRHDRHFQHQLQTPLLDSPAGLALTLQPATDLLLNPASGLIKTQANVHIQSHDYASQATGWRISSAGEGDFRYVFVTEMHAKAFIAEMEQAINGVMIVPKSTAFVATDFTVPGAGAGTITFRAKASVQSDTTTATCPKPAGTVQYDVMLACVASWNSISVSCRAGRLDAAGHTNRRQTTPSFASTTKPPAQANLPAIPGHSAVQKTSWSPITTYYNVDTTTPIDVYGKQGGTTATSVTAPSITTTVAKHNARVSSPASTTANLTGQPPRRPVRFTERDRPGRQHLLLDLCMQTPSRRQPAQRAQKPPRYASSHHTQPCSSLSSRQQAAAQARSPSRT